MTIEPISSIGTLQMQQTTKLQPKMSQTMDGEESSKSSAASSIDRTTEVVLNIGETSQDSEGKKDQGSNQDNSANHHEKLRQAVEQINRKAHYSEAQFGIHEETNRITIKIVDKETKEVIRELPPEKTLDMIAKAWELAGLLVDERR